MTPETFRAVVIAEFRFLSESYDCRVSYPAAKSTDPGWASGYDVSFANATTEVDISFQVPEQLPTIHLRRVNSVPGQMNTASLGLLLLVRAPELNPLKTVTSLPLSFGIEQLLHLYASALKATGHEILSGNFEVFAELQRERDRQLKIRASSPEQFRYF